jgi:hypothetical protein
MQITVLVLLHTDKLTDKQTDTHSLLFIRRLQDFQRSGSPLRTRTKAHVHIHPANLDCEAIVVVFERGSSDIKPGYPAV